jgi:transcriptional regulator with XRE-family HTH domain
MKSMEDMTPAEFTLADLRKAAGLSQLEVGRRMGVNQPRVGQIERDYPRVRFNVMQAYFKALGTKLYVLGAPLKDKPVSIDIPVADIAEDPRGPRDHGYRKKAAS